MGRWLNVARTLLMLLPLSGCATFVVDETESAAIRESVTLDAMHFTDLTFDKAVVATIDAKSPSFTSAGNTERFAAFAIPAEPSPRYLTFASKPFGGIMIYQLKTLVPVFTFLGSDRRAIATLASGTMERRDSFFEGSSFEGRVTVPIDARYVVIHGTRSTPGPLIVHGDPGHVASIPGSPLGVLELKLSSVGMATVQDSGRREDSTKAQLFYLASVDGVKISNAAAESQRSSSGRGFQLTTVFPSRFVPAKPLKVVLVGTHTTGAPIHAIASMVSGSFRSVEAELEFAPEVDKAYVVRGDLEAEKPTVWIEDAATGRPVTKRGTSSDRLGKR